MKRKFFLRFVECFALFCLLAFCMTYLLTDHFVKDYYISREANYLYTEASYISESYATAYFEDHTTLESLYREFKAFSAYYDATIRIITPEGRILLDSSRSFDSDFNSVVDNFDPTISGSQNYMVDNFFNSFSNETLSVIAPITVNYSTRGYITMHRSISSISKDSDRLVNLIYTCCLVVGVCAFIAMLCYYLLYAKTLRTMTRIASRYAEGDFSGQMDIHSHDEFDLISNTFNYMATELSTLEDDQRKFISNISHDFRSPLTSIRGYVEAMKDGTIPFEMQEKYFDIILFETDRLTKLTGNLLELNKFGHNGAILETSSFDLNEVIKKTAASFEGVGRSKHISIDLILTGPEMYVVADMSKIEQVLHNLIDNAVKFSFDNSTIRIETTDRNEKVMVSVKDRGIGIPKASLTKVFDRFYKTDLSRGKDKKGTGLGLAIVKEIITAHGENINVISTEGVGTEFIFSLTKSKK